MKRALLPFFAILALICGGVFLTSLFAARADDSSQSVTINNSTPTMNSVNVAITSQGTDETSITLTENTTTRVYVWGQATDSNSCAEIDTTFNYTVRLYRSDFTSSCSSDRNNCYIGAGTTVTGCSGAGDTTAIYEAYADVYHNADPTDAGSPNSALTWVAYARVAEDSGLSPDTLTNAFEINSLIALNVTSSVVYATVALGAQSDQQTITFTNTGNRDIDTDQSASGDMSCATNGTIPVGNAHLSLSNGFAYASGQALATGATNFNLTLAQRTSEGSASTKNAYLLLLMESSGVKGACSNTVTFTAKADS